MPPKEKTGRSKKYKLFCASLPCAIEDKHQCVGDVVGCHTESGGVGMKGDDLSCIPLCNAGHKVLDEWKGTVAFEEKYDVSIETIQNDTLKAYVRKLEGK